MNRKDKKVKIISHNKKKPGHVEAVILVPYKNKAGDRKYYSQTVHGLEKVILSKGEAA